MARQEPADALLTILHVNVTDAPSARWTARQLLEAFPYDTAPRFLLRDNDPKFGAEFKRCVDSLAIEEVTTAPRSPWQNAFCERLIGSIRRECLDHFVILNAQHLRRILQSYVAYYHGSRTHRSLENDCPDPRAVEPAEMGAVIKFPHVGALHHRYARRLAA